MQGHTTSQGIDYYWFCATIGIQGHLEAGINFAIIQVSISLDVTASATLALEKDHSSTLQVEFNAQVKASVKILFFTISLSYTLDLQTQVSFGSGPAAKITGPSPPSPTPLQVEAAPAAHAELSSNGSTAQGAQTVAAQVLLQPTIRYDTDSGQWTPAAAATLLVDPTTGFAPLAESLASYVLQTYGGYSDPTATLTAAELTAAQTALDAGTFDLPAIYAWLNGASISFSVAGATAGGNAATGAVLPMLPGLTLTYNGTTTTFGDGAPPTGYLTVLNDYLAALSMTGEPGSMTQASGTSTTTPAWAPGVVCADAFNLMAGHLIHELQGVTTSGTLAADLQSVDLANLAGIVTRFLQHGLRVPDPSASGPLVDLPTLALYELTGQQFDVASGVTTATVGVATPSIAVAISGTGTADLPFVLDQAPETGPAAAALPRIQDVPMSVMLHQGFNWSRQGTSWLVFDFPEPLQSQLRLNGALTLALSATEGGATAAPADGEAAMLIRFSLAPIAGVTGVYQVAGTDGDTLDLIELLFASGDVANAQLDLLLPVKGGGSYVTSAADANALLLKTDLSSAGKPQLTAFENLDPLGPTSASLSDASDFVLMLWECSVVHSGGYFLAVSDLDTSDNAASYEVALMVRAASATPQPTLSAAVYQTTVLVSPTGIDASSRIQVALSTADGPVTQPQPGYPAGTVGFGSTWTSMSTPPVPAQVDASDSAAYGAFLYQLYRCRVQAGGSIEASPWSMPVGPNGPDDTAWSYSRAVPVQRLVSGAGATPNRYIAIGQTVELDMQFVDLFGNAAPPSALSLPVVYNDALVTIDQWPGVRFGYAFAAGGQTPALTLTFMFDPTQVSNAQAACDAFGIICDQLTDPRTSLSVTTAMAADPVTMMCGGAPLLTALAGFAAAVKAALDPQVNGAPPGPLTATGTVPLGYVSQIGEDLFPVWVSIELDRQAPSESPAYDYPPGFLSAITQVPLELTDADENPDVAMRDWAIGFEAAFADFDGQGGLLKTLTGSPPTKVSATAARLGLSAAADVTSVPGDLWALRWSPSDGVQVAFPNAKGSPPPAQAPVFFTVMPLSTQLVGGDVTITSYDANGNPLSPTATQTFSAVDLDGWARAFLQAVDGLLAPQSAAAFAHVDAAQYASLMTAKEQLADAISGTVSWVFADQMPVNGSGGMGDLTAAQTSLGESLLTALGADFGTSAIVQVPAEVSVAGTFEPDPSGTPQLYGTPAPQVSEQVAKQYTISPATLPVAAATETLTFLLGAVNPTTQSDLSLQFDYDLAFLDHYFQTSEEQFGYVPSAWLRIIVPELDPGGGAPVLDVPIGALDIPIPLRAYPSPPQLVRQAIVPANATPTLATAAQANYELTIASPSVAQDDLHLALLFNGATEDRDNGGQASDALLAPLAQFRDFQDRYLTQALTAIETGAASADQWLKLLVSAVQAVAAVWGTAPAELAADDDGEPTTLPAPFSWEFRLNVPDESQPGSINLEWVSANGTPPPAGAWPLIEGTAGVAVNANEYHYTLPVTADTATPTLTWQGLSVITVQSLTTAAWTVRNETLAGTDRTTNPALLYSTATVSFPEPVVPLLEVTQPLTVTSSSLSEALSQIVGGVIEPTTPASEIGWGMEASYSFALLSGPPGQLRTWLPVFLARAELSTAANGASGTETIAQFEQDLQTELAAWHTGTAPGGTNAALSFSVTIFASNSNQPLLRLVDVEAPIPGSAWWPAGS